MKTRTLIFAALAGAILAGLFQWLRPEPSDPQAIPADATVPAPVPQTGPLVVTLRVVDGRLVDGPDLIRVEQGRELTLYISSDREDEFHLHGYDLQVALKSGETRSLSFAAEKSGRFDFELHRAHAALGALEVVPR